MKIKVRSPDGDKLLWYCCLCSAKRYISPYLFIICRDYVSQTSIDLMKEYSFTRRRYPAETIIDADDADDIALLAKQQEALVTL